MAARDDRNRELLAPLKLEALTEHEEEHVLGPRGLKRCIAISRAGDCI